MGITVFLIVFGCSLLTIGALAIFDYFDLLKAKKELEKMKKELDKVKDKGL